MSARDRPGRRGTPPNSREERNTTIEDDSPYTESVQSSLVLASPGRRGPDTVAVATVGSDVAPHLKSNAQIDAFRELRTRLIAMATGMGRDYFTTLVVSVSPGSGASYVSRNLAAAFTLLERRVAILVDCNLRNPTQQMSLGLGVDGIGLFDYLENPGTGIERLVRPTRVPGLHLIPAGQPPTRTREYFSSQPMRAVMGALSQTPSYVFLDGPATRDSPDARILSELVDFVVLVAGYGHDTLDGIEQAVALFAPAKFAGVVFNERG